MFWEQPALKIFNNFRNRNSSEDIQEGFEIALMHFGMPMDFTSTSPLGVFEIALVPDRQRGQMIYDCPIARVLSASQVPTH